MESVCAMVLTYNRRALLTRCLTALAGQTRPCDRIVVIDNASSDGTSEMLARDWAGRVECISLPANTGAAGGYHHGMRAAYRTGADLIWAMDDDVIPEPDALNRLLRARATLMRRRLAPPYLVSLAHATSGVLTEVPDIDRRRNALGFPNWGELLDEAIVATRAATFASILLPRETLSRHGLPIRSMFIFGEDREYTLRITRDGPGYTVGSSRVLHARRLEGALDIRTEQDPVRLGYHYFMQRNTVYTLRRYDRRAQLALHLVRQAKVLAQLVVRGKWRRASILIRGMTAGFFYRPEIEMLDEPMDLPGLRPGAADRDTLAAA
jgi:GT2 family glycosyltransferase